MVVLFIWLKPSWILLALWIRPIHEYFPPPDDKLKKRRKVLEDNGIPVFLLPEEAAWSARTIAVRSRSMNPYY